MNEADFLRYYISNASQMMWFLGAGTSRTAGMPSATDIIWDLKIRLYCQQENQEIKNHDVNNESIRRKVQSYFESKDHPKEGQVEEYSFYFEKMFGNDLNAQQKYLSEKLSSSKISLNVGHKVIAALFGMGKCKLVFTTNFDEVIENAYAQICNRSLPTFHLEGSYGALDALNQESFPIYAKVHGDFKYTSIKNLAPDLLHNDIQIQNCFLSASSRYGIVISGYSGRDNNVMDMFEQAITVQNAFPFGLYWIITDRKSISPRVSALIEKARNLNINAHIIESGTFDILLSKIWRLLPDKPDALTSKVSTTTVQNISIPLPRPGSNFPVIRTNALPIIEFPSTCAQINTTINLTYSELIELLQTNKPNATITKTDQILGWGVDGEFERALGNEKIKSIETMQLTDPLELMAKSTFYKSFFERGLLVSICYDRPLQIKRNYGEYIVINQHSQDDSLFIPIKTALSDRYGNLGQISGSLGNGITWQEAVEVKLEIRNNRAWVLLTPDIWIEPRTERRNNIEFLKQRKLYRWNKVANNLLDAWIKVLFEAQKPADDVTLTCYQNNVYPIKYKINTRSGYSRK